LTLEERVRRIVVPPSITFVEVLPPVLLALATVPMWLLPLVPEYVDVADGGALSLHWTLFAVSLLLLTIGGWLSWRRRKSIHAVEQDNSVLKKQVALADQVIDAHHEDLVNSISGLAAALLDEFYAADSRANRENKRRHTRLTVYCRDRRNHEFVPISRKSANPTLQMVGRNRYPDGQGIIARAWKEGFAVELSLPEDRGRWNRDNVEKWDYTEEETSNLKMHSRSMVALRLDREGDAVGIIVIESEKARGVDARTYELFQESALVGELSALLRLLWSNGLAVIRDKHGPEWAIAHSIPEL